VATTKAKPAPKTASPKGITSAISKMHAVRQALVKRGKEAMPTDIQGFVKKTDGIDTTTAHISKYKSSMFKERAGKCGVNKAAGKSGVLAKSTSKELANGKDLNYMDTARQALARLGRTSFPKKSGILFGRS
jgi:hypothetical protein